MLPSHVVLSSDAMNKTDHCAKLDHTRCGSGRYVDNSLFCDGQNHCEDGSDESDLHCKGKT